MFFNGGVALAKNVLVVDDAPEDLEAMKGLLQAAGYGVTSVSDGAKAMDALKDANFDLILIDIRMPTLSGYDLSRLLRQKLNSKVKLIYVSIVPKHDVMMESVDGFVQKPFSPENFTNAVKTVLGE